MGECNYSKVISTHTPVKGVTCCKDKRRAWIDHFNSHAREGRDVVAKNIQGYVDNFNSHAREGRDDGYDKFYIPFIEFQLTRPWRAWLVYKDDEFEYENFNSHAREGRDVG